MEKIVSQMALAALFLGLPLAVIAEDHQLPDQPKAADGGYIVQWDCTANGGQGAFASANTMEYNETFIIAVNLHGTALGEWVMAQPSAPQYTRGVVLNMMRDDQATEYADNGARLWHIRDTIYGALVNFKQLQMKNGGTNNNPSANQHTEIHARLFGHETAFGACASSVTTQSSKGWWQWSDAGGATGWPSSNSWTHGYIHRNSSNYFFRFAPYTGTKTSTSFTTTSSDDVHNQWYDKDHRVNANGFASPFGSASPCPRFYTTDYALNTTTTTVCPVTNQSATIYTNSFMADYTYLLYRDGTLVAGSEKDGSTISALSWTSINQPGTYTVWYYKTSEHNTPVQMIPCSGNSEITLTSPTSCCNIGGVTITISNTNPGMGETIHVRADITGTNDGNAKTFYWEVHGAGTGVGTNLANTVTITTDNMTYSEFDISYTQWKDIAGVYADGGNNGWYTFWCKVTEEGYTCNQQIDKQVHVQKELICPTFTWAIDGTAGLATPMYPGGWYNISVTTEAGAPAPTLTISGTGVEVKTTTPNGNTTTCLIHLSGDATGEMSLNAHTDANTAAGYKACDDAMTPTIAECGGATAQTWKIEWFNYNGATQFPEYWIAGGAPVYLRDNAGKLEADIAHTDGQDEWFFIATGETKHGEPVYYIRNGLTRRYLHRGTQHGKHNNDDTWEYAEALLDATLQASDDNYKWVLYPFNGDTIFACVAEFNSTTNIAAQNNNANGSPYVLHIRPWEAGFNNPLIQKPGVACGKMGGQGGSPVFYMKHRERPAVSGLQQRATLSWQGTAPAAEVKLSQGDNCTYTATRTDAIHSLNSRIWYETADATIATVDAQTGLVTAVTADGETDILVILNDTGCFRGDTLRYRVMIYDCGEKPIISSPKTTVDKNEQVQLTITNPAGTGEVGTWVFTQNDGTNASITADGIFSATNYGTYTFYYKITNASHPDCDRQSDPVTIIGKQKEDYSLPDQPKAADGTYIVLWDCATNNFAAANTMEWGETFVFAVNLHGTPLGNWVMQQPSQAGAVRTIAFDRLLVKNGDDNSEHFDLDASRLWLIRDTIFGATFNFKQIALKNGSYHTPANGATTGIAARLFGVEAAHGDKCGNTPSVSKWWVWSDVNGNYAEFGGQWLQNKYVSNDDEYLFHFAPYSGKSDPVFNSQSDDTRDRWYDGGQDFNLNGYASPCPKDWPQDQTVQIDKTQICVAEGQTATLTLGGSETGWNYALYQGTALVDTKSGTGSALTWTLTAAGNYSVQAVATDPAAQHDDLMASCTNQGIRALTDGGCFTPSCPDPVTIPYPNLTYNLNAEAFGFELAEASGTNVRYQWYCYTDDNPTPVPFTGEGATTANCIPATNKEGKTYYYCMVYTDDCPDGVRYCNTADVTVQGCQTFNGTTFTVTANKTTCNEGESVTLTANFNGYGGEHTYVWTLNGTPIDSTETHQIVQDFQTSTLTIPATVVADGGKYEVTIHDGDCQKSATITITVKEVTPVEPDERVIPMTVCMDEPVTLSADQADKMYTWSTGATTQSITVTPTAPGTETYTVRTYEYKIQSSNNLMANGDFEDYTDYHQRPTGFTSDYEYLPYDPNNTEGNMYDKPGYGGKSGIYLLTANAKGTWRGYASVTPHGGKYFAMFDAAQSGFAWRTTTNDNPQMKLQQGAKYIFSYWAADLNTGSERNHPAELQFSINYKQPNGQMKKEDLGPKLTLGVDNKWHYSEFFWTAPCNSDYIEIGVEDRCNYAGPGNDFGLDDIIFQMITGQMEVTLDRQKFVLTVEDCTPPTPPEPEPEPETCEEVIYRKWNDLLFVDNYSNGFTSYQWFRDGHAINGATGQYYYEEGLVLSGDGHTYHCVMTKADGSNVTACEHLFDDFPASVQAGRQPAPERQFLFSPTGKLLYQGEDIEAVRSTLQPGCYFVHHLSEDGENYTTKLMIP